MLTGGLGPAVPYPSAADPAVREAATAALGLRYSLPVDTAAFTGRSIELDHITAAVTGQARPGGVVTIRAIDGMPGVGKTALAVHAAHLLRDQFPDRQLFIDLHGHTPGQDPVGPDEALAGLLAATGVDPRYLPADRTAGPPCGGTRWPGSGRCWCWTTRPAAPRSPRCCRAATAAWCWSPAAATWPTCPARCCRSCWRRCRRARPGRCSSGWRPAPPAARAGAVAELAALAGFLPLAISLLARVYNRHPSWTLADLAAETRASLLTLAAEHDSVAAAFEVSYQHLTPASRTSSACLGLHPGTTIDAYAAAALAGVPLAEAARLLDALHGEGLLTETGYRRYGMHDLIRRYAADRAAADPAAGREQALGGCSTTTSTPPPRRRRCWPATPGSRPARPRPRRPPRRPACLTQRAALAWTGPSGPACWPASTMPRGARPARLVGLTARWPRCSTRRPVAEATARHEAAAGRGRRLATGWLGRRPDTRPTCTA